VRYFFSAFLRSPGHVASVIPSSGFTSRTMSSQVDCTGAPIKILELGAGTGPITAEIVKKLRPEDHLDVVEIDPDMCEILQEKFDAFPNVSVRCISVFDWNPEYKYDFIISALPHNTFGIEFVGSVLDKYKDLIKPDGVVTYIELMFMGNIKKLFISGKKGDDYLKTQRVIAEFRDAFIFKTDTVLLNIPPAKVYHLKVKK